MSDLWLTEASANDETGLRAKVAIVAGASAEGDGLTNGRAAAIVLGRAGTKVVCVGRRQEQADRTVSMITSQGGEAIAVVGDCRNEADCERIVEQTLSTYGRLDFLDNNVGTGIHGTVVDLPIESWREAWAINVETMILMSKHAIPAMITSAGGGVIVNIGSLRAIRPYDAGSPYTAAKAAVMALTQAMAIDHGEDNIRVNCIVLGPVFTSKIERRMVSGQRERRRLASPMHIEGTAWDTANAVAFLLSNHSRFITGQGIVLDGGVSVMSPER